MPHYVRTPHGLEVVEIEPKQPTAQEQVKTYREEMNAARSFRPAQESAEALENPARQDLPPVKNERVPCPHCEFSAASAFGLSRHVAAKHPGA